MKAEVSRCAVALVGGTRPVGSGCGCGVVWCDCGVVAGLVVVGFVGEFVLKRG